ncbi:MAG: hypothetical protein VX822_03530 [Candidatus Neomarinimicrobiota bacterium]|nr:hypothetical protein [Candidatus Neomarinimicrobiota bacterium]
MNFSSRLVILPTALIIWKCSGSSTPQSRPSPPKPISAAVEVGSDQESTQSRLEFFPTANRARENIAALLTLTESRVDATLTILSDELISDSESGEMSQLKSQEETAYSDMIFDLDAFIGYLPTDSKSYAVMSQGRINVEAKYKTFSLSLSAGAADQVIDQIEKSAIESNTRALVEELRSIEASLPLPPDSLETGATFIFESDSVDLFFEVVNSVEDMTKEMEDLRKTVAEFGAAKQDMESFLDRERALTSELEQNKSQIVDLSARLDTTRREQTQAADSMGVIIRQTDASLQDRISNLSVSITDSILSQKSESDSLFFSLGTNIAYFQTQIDSLKGIVRYYDIAEKGLPEIDEDVLDILKLPVLRHKVTLENGTVIVGHKLAENLDIIIMETTIGKLVIDRNYIVEYDEQYFPGPKVEFVGAYAKMEYPNREEFIGRVRNTGKRRADFVKVTFFLWASTTEPLGIGDAMVDGTTTKFATGVISDASLEPGQMGTYRVVVDKQKGAQISYRTNEVTWRDYKAKE